MMLRWVIRPFQFLGCLMLLGWLLLIGIVVSSLLDSRPQNLRGDVQCRRIPTTSAQSDPTQPLVVTVVVDEAAIQQHSRVEVLREVLPASRGSIEEARLVVDIGMATGAITGCGTFEDDRIRV